MCFWYEVQYSAQCIEQKWCKCVLKPTNKADATVVTFGFKSVTQDFGSPIHLGTSPLATQLHNKNIWRRRDCANYMFRYHV